MSSLSKPGQTSGPRSLLPNASIPGPRSSGGPSAIAHDHPGLVNVSPRRSIAAKLVGGALVGGLIAAAAFSYDKFKTQTVAPREARTFGESVALIATPSALPQSGHKYVAQHAWLPDVRVAQALISEGKYDEALAMLRRLHEKQQHPMVRSLIDQIEIATQGRGSNARCLVTGYARPRRYDLLSQDKKANDAGRPGITVGINGAMMTWVDDRDGQRRAYAVPLDESLRNAKLPVDITPEGNRVVTPTLLALPERYLASYWDTSGANSGVFLRWIGKDAVIGGPPVKATTERPGAYYAKATRTSDGGFVVAWSQRLDADSVDLFYRRFDANLKPVADRVRVTDYLNRGKIPSRVQAIEVVEHGGFIHFAFEHITGTRQVRYIRVPVDAPAPGLKPWEKGQERKDRTLSPEIIVTPKNAKGRYPSLACDDSGCFITWSQSLPNGAAVAFVDAKTGKKQWHKPFSNKGRHPNIAIAASGDIQIVWIEDQRILTASLGREGVGPTSKVARIVGDQPPPMIAPGGKRGEWYVAWLDIEHNHREPYAARMQCQ